MDRYSISERDACSLVGLSRTAYRYMPLPRDDEAPFRAEVVRLACALTEGMVIAPSLA
jgi:putative transposase